MTIPILERSFDQKTPLLIGNLPLNQDPRPKPVFSNWGAGG